MQTDWINNSKEWNRNIPSPLSPSVAVKFQQDLNQICGTEPDGTPHLRLAWGMDLDINSPTCDGLYDREGFWVPRHHWTTRYENFANHETGLIELRPVYIGVPRYYILAYVPPVHIPEEQRKASFEGGEFFTEDMNRNQWVDFMEMEDHVNKNEDGEYGCCLDAARDGLNCHGMYGTPNQKDLRYVTACYKRWQQLEREIAPDKRFDAADHVGRWREKASQKKRIQAELAREHQEDFMDFFKTNLTPSVVVPAGIF